MQLGTSAVAVAVAVTVELRWWCQWWRREWRWCWMRAGGGWGASRYVPSVLAVEGQRVSACPPLAAMPSTATSQTGPLASALSLPKPVIALAAISDSIPFLSLSKLFLPFSFLFFLTDFGGLDSVGCVWMARISVLVLFVYCYYYYYY